jgi:hypothetical protein
VLLVTTDVDVCRIGSIGEIEIDEHATSSLQAGGHSLLPGHMIVGNMPCSCGRHATWGCECSDVTYEPVLTESCTLFKRRRAVRSR